MATNDTDPQRTQPFAEDASRTEPESDAKDVAASLLADLSKGSRPTDNVAETEGHVAAAYAGAPHRPPRANDKTVENPAVFINATVPLPPPPSSGRVKLGPPAPSVVSMNGAPTVVDGARLFGTTEPGERAKNQMRVMLASIAGVVVAALIVIFYLLVTAPPRAPVVSPSSPVTTATATSSSIIVVTPVAAPTPSPTLSAQPTNTAKPAPGARPRPSSSSRSSGTFADPDRTF